MRILDERAIRSEIHRLRETTREGSVATFEIDDLQDVLRAEVQSGSPEEVQSGLPLWTSSGLPIPVYTLGRVSTLPLERLQGEITRAGFDVVAERRKGPRVVWTLLRRYQRGRSPEIDRRFFVSTSTFARSISTGIVASHLLREICGAGLYGIGVSDHETYGLDRSVAPLVSSVPEPEKGEVAVYFYGPWSLSMLEKRLEAHSDIYRIGYFYHEWHRAPMQAVHTINKVFNEAHFISTFCRDAFVNSGVRRPGSVVPHGYDPDVFHPERCPKRLEIKSNREVYVFTSVAHQQKRKGTYELIEAFTKEFAPGEPVKLILKDIPRSYFSSEPFPQRWPFSVKIPDPRIEWITEDWSDCGVADLMRDSDCFVLPTYAEGFGIPLLEAKACGIPVITTRFGGQSEFCFDDDTCFVETDMIPRSDGQECAVGDFTLLWAKPRIESLRECMRRTYEDRDDAARRAETARNRVSGMTWKAALAPFVAHLKDFARKIPKDFARKIPKEVQSGLP